MAALVSVTAGCTAAEPFDSSAFHVKDGPTVNPVGSGGTSGFDAGGPTGGSVGADDAGPGQLAGTGGGSGSGGSGGAMTDALSSGSGGSGGAMTDALGSGGSANLSMGLVGYWTLDEGTGTTIADSSGHSNGTLTGPSWASADNTAPTKFTNPSALVFNGSPQYAQIPRTPALEPASFSVSLWAKRTAGAKQDGFAKIFEKQYTTSGPYLSIALNINHTSTDPTVVTLDVSQMVAGTATARNISSGSGAMPDGTWTHIVGIYDPAGPAPQERLYINGALSGSASFTDPIAYDTSGTGDFYLGKSGRNLQYFIGSIDDVRFYNRALTETEISSLAGN